jgi:DNA invertase Pin-like site-specific DNA recombinase
MRDYAAHRGFQIVDSYVDVGISGAKDRRPQLDRLMSDARKRQFDACARAPVRSLCPQYQTPRAGA